MGRPRKHEKHGAAWGRTLGILLLAFCAMPLLATVRSAGGGAIAGSHQKFSSDLVFSTHNPQALITVNVQFRNMPDESALQGYRGRGAVIKHHLNAIRAVTMRIPASFLAELEKNPEVLYVTPDRPVHMTTVNEEYATAVEADVAATNFPSLNGAGVGVAIIDSGVADHDDLHSGPGTPSRVVYAQSFVAGDTTTPDKYGHGTHVAGLIAGSGVDSGTGNGYSAKYAGVASAANIINLRVLEAKRCGCPVRRYPAWRCDRSATVLSNCSWRSHHPRGKAYPWYESPPP